MIDEPARDRLPQGLWSCTVVRKNDPKFPGVEAAPGITRVSDSEAVPVADTARTSGEANSARESETFEFTSPV